MANRKLPPNNKRSMHIGTTITPDELTIFNDACVRYNITASALIREAVTTYINAVDQFQMEKE